MTFPSSTAGRFRPSRSVWSRRGAALILVLGMAMSLVSRAEQPPSCNGATDTVAAATRTGPAARFDHGLLWRIDRPGDATAPPPSHLFGTVHVGDKRAKALVPAVREALAEARSLMPELLLDDANQRAFVAAARLPSGQSLSQLLGSDDFDVVAGRLSDGYRIPRVVADSLKPWAAYLTLSQPMQSEGEVVDEMLIRTALERGLPVRPLETIQQQLAAFEAVPLRSQIVLLTELARNHAQAQSDIPALVDCYLAGDLAGIRRQEASPEGSSPAMRAALSDLFVHLLDQRNRRMVAVLLPALEQGGVFVAVGALHLQGERGLLNLLQQSGWRVQRAD